MDSRARACSSRSRACSRSSTRTSRAAADCDDPALVADAHRYALAQGIDDVPIEVVDVSAFTNAPNAEAAGFGPSRKIILWSTLLDGRFDENSVRVVVAHELGHHSREHIAKSILWYALFAFPGAYLIARITRRRGGMREPEAVPLALLVLVVLSFLALPLNNMITRHMEAEADWVGARDDEGSGRCEAALPAASPRSSTPIRSRRPGRTSSWRRTRRSSSGSRWPRPGRTGSAAGRSPDSGC